MIVLLTDFGNIDPYVGIMKGVIKQIHPISEIIDLSHQIPAQSITTATFILQYSFFHFPEGTVFCVVVDPGVGSNRLAIAIKTKKYFFVGPDNGIFSFITQQNMHKKIIELNNQQYYYQQVPDYTFHGRDIFAPAAAYLDKGENINSLGTAIGKIKELETINYKIINQHEIHVPLLHIDHFGNLIFAMKKNDFDRLLKKSSFIIKYQNFNFSRIDEYYLSKDQLIALFNSYGLLEIAAPAGNAWDLTNTNENNCNFLIISIYSP